MGIEPKKSVGKGVAPFPAERFVMLLFSNSTTIIAIFAGTEPRYDFTCRCNRSNRSLIQVDNTFTPVNRSKQTKSLNR